MPKYRNTKTGVVVDVPEALAASLHSYEAEGAPAAKGQAKDAEKPTRRRSLSSKSDS